MGRPGPRRQHHSCTGTLPPYSGRNPVTKIYIISLHLCSDYHRSRSLQREMSHCLGSHRVTLTDDARAAETPIAVSSRAVTLAQDQWSSQSPRTEEEKEKGWRATNTRESLTVRSAIKPDMARKKLMVTSHWQSTSTRSKRCAWYRLDFNARKSKSPFSFLLNFHSFIFWLPSYSYYLHWIIAHAKNIGVSKRASM